MEILPVWETLGESHQVFQLAVSSAGYLLFARVCQHVTVSAFTKMNYSSSVDIF